jgi:hypothetical protein
LQWAGSFIERIELRTLDLTNSEDENMTKHATRVRYRHSFFVATARHASTSLRLLVGEMQRTDLSASKITSENGTLIESANSRRDAAGIFL